MHATIEHLLSLRDGEPSDARVAEHLAECPRCAGEREALRAQAEALRGLPEHTAPEVWPQILDAVQAPARSRRRFPFTPLGWAVTAVAASVLVVAVLINLRQGPEPAPGVAPPAVPAVVELGSPRTDEDLAALLARSRQLESALRAVAYRPRLMDARTAETIAGLEERIAVLDYGLSADVPLNAEQTQRLWEQRVDLMDSLVQVRGAQLQPVAYRPRTDF